MSEKVKVAVRAVKQSPSVPFTSSAYFVALMLVLFSASGLLTGVVMRKFAASLRPPSGSSNLASADMTATAGAITPTSPAAFTLHVAVSPTSAKVGQTIQIAVSALGNAASAPVAGVRCSLVMTADSLALSPWPDPVTTDSAGHAQWSITVPQTTTPGPYTLSLRGDGPTGYRFTWRQTLSISV